MFLKHRSTGVVGLGLVLAVVAWCAQHVTGGGMVESATGHGRAKFVINFDGSAGRLKATNADQPPPVRMKIDALVNYSAETQTRNDCMQAIGRYESKEKERPRSGQVNLVACDDARKGKDDDTVLVQVIDGPFAGYFNNQKLLSGNAVVHDTPQPEPEDD